MGKLLNSILHLFQNQQVILVIDKNSDYSNILKSHEIKYIGSIHHEKTQLFHLIEITCTKLKLAIIRKNLGKHLHRHIML